jgi:alpha-tubulin suppressor-like RCC1 family protein
MPQVNTSCIQARYNEQLARLYHAVNYDPDSVLSYALSGVDLSDVGVIIATDVSSLPYLYFGSSLLPDGMVYFVQSLGIIVISSNNTWLTLDGTVVRTDTDYNNAIWAWGCNNCGQFGDNTTVSKSSPVSVVGGFTDWQQVSVGCEHSLGLRTNGTIWAWGIGDAGRLGDNTIVNKSSPVSVVGGFTDWCQVAAGMRQSFGLRTNGTIWSWGYNQQAGSLGDGTTVNKSSPVSVVGGFTNWCQIAASGTSNSACQWALAVRQNGTAWAWGWNSCGQLGDNTTLCKSSPISVLGGFTDWCRVSAGAQHSMGLRQTGQLYAWGNNNTGQLGNNNTTTQLTPVAVVGGFTDWCQFNPGGVNSFAIRTSGTLWAWGQAGALGDNTAVNKSSPVSVVGGFTDWCQVSGGFGFALAVRQGGSAWAWGDNNCGQLGINTTVAKSSPVSVAGGINNWFQVSAGRAFGAGITFN